MKRVLLLSLLVFSMFSYAEYKAEEIDDATSYKVDYEVESEEDKSRTFASEVESKDESKEKDPVEEQEIERQELPFWDFKKEKF